MFLRQAWRSWRSARAVAILASAALAAGIGAATAIYTVVNAVMLKPLPYRDAGRFVALFSAATNDPEHYGSLSFADAEAYQQRTQAFDAFGWFREAGKNLTYKGEPYHIQGVAVSAAFVRHLGADPAVGQWFHDDTGVVISRKLWRVLGSDDGIVGKALTLDGRSYTVTGIMPDGFHLPVAGITSAGVRTDLWIALERETVGAAYFAYARRKPEVSFAAAEADVRRVAAEIAAADPAGHPSYTARLYDLRETVIKDVRPTLLLLFAASGLLFLITSANAAGLLLARSVARARETAVRVALGARRGQLAVQYLSESLPVAVAGAAGGILVSTALTPLIVSMAADYLPQSADVTVDWTVLLFAFGAALLAMALSSLAPLWQAMRTPPADALGEGARASAGARSRRLSQALVVGEIALAFSLLAASAVLLVHLRSLARTPLGFDPSQVLTFGVSVPGTIAARGMTRVPHQRRLVDAVRAVPGVDEVSFANQLPLDGCCFGTNIYPEGRSLDPRASQRMSLMAVTPDYFKVMRIPLRRGRLLTERDTSDQLLSVVIDEAAALHYWGSNDPVGSYGRFLTPTGSRFQVLGVVGDIKNDGISNPTVPEVYILSSIINAAPMNFVVRSSRAPASLIADIRHAVRGVDAEQPVHDAATMTEIVARSMTLERAASFLTGFFAAAALLLATLGVYGVVSYAVRQRTVEIGTRMALGATNRTILALVVRDGLTMAAMGVAVGVVAAIVGAIYLSRVFETELGAAPFVYSTSIIGAVALAASFVPAWRASLLSPMVAIRNQPESMWRAARQRVQSARRTLVEVAETLAVPLGALITEFADSVRRAASVPEATEVALATLRERAGAQSIALLEKNAQQEYRCAHCAIAADGFLLQRLRHYPHPLTITVADFDAWLRWAREFRPAVVAELEGLRNTGARVAVPLRTRNEIVGVLLLGPPEGRDRYTEAERKLLGSAADVFALMIENARLTDRAVEQEKLRRDLALAAEVQRRLLPPHPPASPGVALAAFTLPARTVGGDYYDFLDLGGGDVAFAVADVSGKGIAAALLMSVVQASLRVITAQGECSAARLASRMNGFLYQSTGANKYATFFYGRIEQGASRLRYVNAGHNPPYLVRRMGETVEVLELSAGGTVIGLFPEMPYDETVVPLSPGDLLVAFTDGVTEALNASDEEFGEARMKDFLRGIGPATADEVSSRLQATMREWIGGADQYDDLTFVVVAVQER